MLYCTKVLSRAQAGKVTAVIIAKLTNQQKHPWPRLKHTPVYTRFGNLPHRASDMA
jgi:hypothetical protein